MLEVQATEDWWQNYLPTILRGATGVEGHGILTLILLYKKALLGLDFDPLYRVYNGVVLWSTLATVGEVYA